MRRTKMSDKMIEITEEFQEIIWEYRNLLKIDSEEECFDLAYKLAQYAAERSDDGKE